MFGTVGALRNSNQGPVICIFNKVAYTGKHHSIISSIQLEHYLNQVNDTAILKTGKQAHNASLLLTVMFLDCLSRVGQLTSK